jgi:hypothetical protein
MMLGFSGYLVFGKSEACYLHEFLKFSANAGLIIGLTYDRITTIIPLFVVLYVVL